MPRQRLIVVSQCNNPKFDPTKEENLADNSKLVYRVESCQNTICLVIGQMITPEKLNQLMLYPSYINFSIRPPKELKD